MSFFIWNSYYFVAMLVFFFFMYVINATLHSVYISTKLVWQFCFSQVPIITLIV